MIGKSLSFTVASVLVRLRDFPSINNSLGSEAQGCHYCSLQAPEMVRIPLEELVLQIHSLKLGPAAQFFERVLEPPPTKSITGAVEQLAAVGALTDTEQLTPLGNPESTSRHHHPCATSV